MSGPRPLGTVPERMLILAEAGEAPARIAELFGIREEDARLMLWGLHDPARLRTPPVGIRREDRPRR